jgi:Sel1 repeat-containing protein
MTTQRASGSSWRTVVAVLLLAFGATALHRADRDPIENYTQAIIADAIAVALFISEYRRKRRAKLIESRPSAPTAPEVEHQSAIQPTKKLVGKLTRFAARCVTPTSIIIVATLLLLASWIYPPWVGYGRYSSHDWTFIFDTHTGSMRIDVIRLLLIDLIIAVPAGLIAYGLSQSSTVKIVVVKIVAFALILVPAVALACLVGLAISKTGESKVWSDFQRSVEVANRRRLAESGDSKIQFNLGVFYHDGAGVPQDFEEAVKWYRKSADNGFPYAQNNLGVCYQLGQGVLKNYEEAAKWYRAAALQGHATAQNNLGICYELGEGIRKDYEEAYFWYILAAMGGNKDAAARRDLIEARLDPSLVAKTQRRAAEFVPQEQHAEATPHNEISDKSQARPTSSPAVPISSP